MSTFPRGPERLEQVLQVAAQLFARQGYHATSTREIARMAEISENTLFRQFESKEQIFWAALKFRFESLRLRRELLDGIIAVRTPEVVLPQLIEQLVDIAFLNPDTLRLVAVAFLEFRWETGNVCTQSLAPVFSIVKTYLTQSIDKGTLRKIDPAILTATLALSVVAFPEVARILDGSARYPDNRGAIEAFSRFWLTVLLPPRTELVTGPAPTAWPPLPN